ncbi:MAG: hemin-degrading factor, partial [Litoreibacter sp.]|nr:hemin-degrading factor [Litoreibacter sp.]
MSDQTTPTPEEIRVARNENAAMRERDLSDKLGISEGQLIAAHTGEIATRIEAHPDIVMAAAQKLGEVMALTRNVSCVHEKVGTYDNYHTGHHAAMVLTEEIDLRIFPSHWKHAFLVERESEGAPRRSIQVFDAAGDAVHKIFLRDDSNHDVWGSLKSELSLSEQSDLLAVEHRQAPETPKSDLSKLDILRKEWARMTDTHQFMRLTSKLKMNRLGAYRIVGEPFVRSLEPAAAAQMLHK